MAHFVVSEWTLGLLLAVYTEKGLHSVFLGKQSNELMKTLELKFPEVQEMSKAHAFFKDTQSLVDYANFKTDRYTGPLDLQGTLFQKEVWNLLQKIPFGETMTYSGVSKQLGRAKAYRAVAQACGANSLPLVIPCHRVVGQKGLGGYRYGIELKERLIQKESLKTPR